MITDKLNTEHGNGTNTLLTAGAVNETRIANPCRICDKWSPENGCTHYLPDSETILLKAGYRIYKPGIDTRQKKFIVVKDKQHRFESLAKAAAVLIHHRT
jgi:hypothetical protein